MAIIDVESFVNGLHSKLDHGRPDPDSINVARQSLAQALAQESFVLDCLKRVNDTIDQPPGPWSNPPILECSERGISVRVIYWPPQFSNAPHEHLTWTLTGVLHNRLDVRIYEPNPTTSEPGFVVTRNIIGRTGDTGCLVPPCIHAVHNPTDRDAASIHIFSGTPDHETQQDEVVQGEASNANWFASQDKGSILRGAADRALLCNLEIAQRIGNAPAIQLMERIFTIGSLNVKLAAVKSMCHFDIALALQLLESLLPKAEGQDKRRLTAIYGRLKRAIESEGR